MRTFSEQPKANQKATTPKASKPDQPNSGARHDVSLPLYLQRSIGNQEAQRLLQGYAEGAPRRLGHTFSHIPVRPPKADALQTKLAINKPGDEYEQEADCVAEQVMRMPEPQLQRTCACGGGCPKCKGEQGSRERLHTKSVSVDTAGHGVLSAEPVVREASASGVSVEGGQPLPDSVRSYFEPRFGHDFRDSV